MAELVKLFELDIDVDKAVADIVKSKQAVEGLKQQINELKKAEGDNSVQIADLTAKLQAEQKELRTNEAITKNVVSANRANAGSIDQLRAQLSVVTAQWNRLSKEERENTTAGKALSKQKLDLTNKIKGETMATGDARINVGFYTQSIQEAFGMTGQFVPAIGKASTAIGGMGKAFTVALGPIGLIIVAIGLVISALKAFYSSSEEGQNAFDKLWAVVDVVVGNIIDAFSELGKAMQQPRALAESFVKFFQDTFGNIIGGVLDVVANQFKALASTVNLSYQQVVGIFSDNEAKIKEAKERLNKDIKGIEDGAKRIETGALNIAGAWDQATDALGNFIDENIREAKIAQELADRQAKLDKNIRAALVANAKASRDAAELKNKAVQKDNFASAQRVEFLKQAIAIEEQILKRNLYIAQQQLFIAKQKASLSNSDKETLDEIARLEAEVFRVQETNFSKQKELQGQLTEAVRAAKAQEVALAKKAAYEKLKADWQYVNESIKAFEAVAQANKERLEADAAFQDEFQKEQERQAEQLQIDYTNRYELAKDNMLSQLALEREGLEMKKQQEIEYAESIGADVTLIEEKYANAREQIAEAEKNVKLSLAADFAGNLAQIAGEGTAIGKAAAVAQTTVSTYQAATGAYAALAGIPVAGPALGIAAAAAAVAAGLANVKKILAVDSGLPGGSGGGRSGSLPSTSTAQSLNIGAAPTLNQGIVSRETIIQNQQGISVQPTLVIDDVTAKQNRDAAKNKTSTL